MLAHDERPRRGGTRESGWLLEPLVSIPGWWLWQAWHRAERMEGEAPDRAQAAAALMHFHAPDD